MMDIDSTSLPPRIPGRVIANSDATATIELSAANRSSFLAGKMLRGADVVQSRSRGTEDATTTLSHHNRPANALSGRDNTTSHGYTGVQEAVFRVIAEKDGDSARSREQGRKLQIPSSNSNSQDTTTTNDSTDDIFTPPVSAGGLSGTESQSNGQDSSSQGSQLLQLSQIAATREKMTNSGEGSDGSSDQNVGPSRKRMADGIFKSPSEGSAASPVFRGGPIGHGHSRNTSTVSVTSTTASNIGELSAQLKTRLSYAMVKVNNGWQSHTIDQVETLASQSGSPTSSNSTIHLRQGASASPQLSTSSYRGSNSATPSTGLQPPYAPGLTDASNPAWRDPATLHTNAPSRFAPSKQTPSLAPPISIEPFQQLGNPRRNTNARHTPSLAPHSHLASPNTAPHTPGQPSPYPTTSEQQQRTPQVDPMLFSPQPHQTPQQQNVREQDAMEALLFMSSPGNSANLKHNFPSSSQPLNQNNRSTTRTALPGSQPRKSLPSGRPTQNPVPHPYGPSSSSSSRQAEYGGAGAMDVDQASPYTSSRGAPRKKLIANGTPELTRNATPARLKQLPLSAGLEAPARPRPRLKDEDIERMLDSVARQEESDDDEGEIVIPVRQTKGREEVAAAAAR